MRLPGTQALKFAVEKNKLWVLDEENIEYETKVVKLVQKDAIVDPLTRAAARSSVRLAVGRMPASADRPPEP